jgi:hypothetical protein
MSRPRTRLLPASLAVAALALLALPLAAAAAPPEDRFLVEHVDETFVAPVLTAQCGFTVLVRREGTIVFSADPVEIARIRLTTTFIGPNGATLTSPDVGVDKTLSVVEDAAGNTVVTVQSTGVLFSRITVPGEGVVNANVGREVVRLTFDAAGNLVDFEVIEDVGLSRVGDEAELAALCAYLAQ